MYRIIIYNIYKRILSEKPITPNIPLYRLSTSQHLIDW